MKFRSVTAILLLCCSAALLLLQSAPAAPPAFNDQLYSCHAMDGVLCFPQPAASHGGDRFTTHWPGGAWISEIRPTIAGTGRVDLWMTDDRGVMLWHQRLTTNASWPRQYAVPVGVRVPPSFKLTWRSLPALQPDWHHGPYTPPPLPRMAFAQAQNTTSTAYGPGIDSPTGFYAQMDFELDGPVGLPPQLPASPGGIAHHQGPWGTLIAPPPSLAGGSMRWSQFASCSMCVAIWGRPANT